MNARYNKLIIKSISIQQLFIKPFTKRKAMSGVVLPFSFHQSNPFVEDLMRV